MSSAVNPLVSIIVPVYNVERYIDVCMDSIRQQTYRNLEIIVVEDCSTDNSRQTLEHHLKDQRIKLIQHVRNSGLSAARNTGIEAATGEYLMFVDSDDIVDTRLVKACVYCAVTTGAELVTYGFSPFEDGTSKADLPYPSLDLELKPVLGGNEYFGFPHFAWLKFIRTDVVQCSELRFPVGLYYEDWPFHWHLGLSIKSRYQLPVDFYLYRQRGTSITGSTGEKLLDLFIIHSLVLALVRNYKAYEIEGVLASKIIQSHWSILTRIESEFLVSALRNVKEAKKLKQLNGCKYDLTLRNIIISVIACVPSRVALPALQVLRSVLRRKAELKRK